MTPDPAGRPESRHIGRHIGCPIDILQCSSGTASTVRADAMWHVGGGHVCVWLTYYQQGEQEERGDLQKGTRQRWADVCDVCGQRFNPVGTTPSCLERREGRGKGGGGAVRLRGVGRWGRGKMKCQSSNRDRLTGPVCQRKRCRHDRGVHSHPEIAPEPLGHNKKSLPFRANGQVATMRVVKPDWVRHGPGMGRPRLLPDHAPSRAHPNRMLARPTPPDSRPLFRHWAHTSLPTPHARIHTPGTPYLTSR